MRYWVQRTGNCYVDDKLIGSGYSGHGEGVNNPMKDDVQNVGPAPAGYYTLGQPFTHPRTGPFTMRLFPQNDPQIGLGWMNCRDGIMCHGDNAEMNHTASDGCLILARQLRVLLNSAPGRGIRVVHEESDYQAALQADQAQSTMNLGS